MKKISVIVPVYKVEKYLNRCVDSIIKQTYKNLEIILVDDGSPDRCPEICDEYAKQDNRVKVIHKKNGGLSEARNFGIDVATGEYIAFVDSDDYINEKMYDIFISELESNNSDIVIGNFKSFDDNSNIKNKNIETYKVENLTNLEALKNMCTGGGTIYTVAWNKLYKKALFDEIRYPVGKIHEDEFITYKLIYNSSKITYLDTELYYYYQRADSIMGSKMTPRNLSVLEALEERAEFFENNQLENLLDYNDRVLFFVLLKLYNGFRFQRNNKIYKELRLKISKLYKSIKNQKSLKLKNKIKYMLANYVPEIFCLIYR